MTDAQKIPAAIQWHEGMLLAPQHFQRSAQRQEELLHYHVAAAAPFHWGIQLLKVDQVLLIDGVLRISAIEAVMPDGLVVSYQQEDEYAIEVDLNPFVEEMKTAPKTVHLAVPAKKVGGASIKGALPRYDSVESPPVPDDNTGESELSMPVLRPRISLLVTETPPKKYNTFPLVKVAYRNETFTLAEYVAPTLRVAVNSVLGEMCSNVARRMREKAIFLSEQVRSSAAGLRGPVVLETKALIQSLVSGLPQFEAVLNTGVSHPYLLYLALSNLVGQTASLGLGLVPPVLATYDHNNLLAVFSQAKDYVFRMIEEGIIESHTAVSFDFKKNVYGIKLQPDWMAPDLAVGLRMRQGMIEKDMLDWMRECLIGSSTKVESMKERRVLGPERERVEGDGDFVPPRGVVLFSVKTDPAFIEPGKILLVFNPSDPKHKRGPAEMILYIRNKPEKRPQA